MLNTLSLCSSVVVQKHNQLNAIYMNHDSAIGRRRLDQKEQHALLSTIDSGGDFNQWLKENKGPIEEQEEHDRDLQIVDPDKLKFLDVIVKNCVFEVCVVRLAA
jgi:hypothetical protein